MKKIDSPFQENELEFLRSSYARIGKKHGTTGQYVGKIANGQRAMNTSLAKAIHRDLKKLLTLLKPDNNEK